MADTYEFSCPNCSQALEGTYDHIGLETECPGCGKAFVIPNFLNTSIIGMEAIKELQNEASDEELAEAKRSNTFVFETFSDTQLGDLEQLEGKFLDKARKLKCRNRWEYAIVAALLDHRMGDFRQAVNTEYEQEHQGSWHLGHGKYDTFLKKHCHEYFDIIAGLAGILGESLDAALNSGDLSVIFRLADEFQVLVGRLTEFHQANFSERVPHNVAYIQVNEAMIGWAPEICGSLDKVIVNLMKNCSKMRDSWTVTPQISFVGTSLPILFNASGTLKIGFTKPQTVQASI